MATIDTMRVLFGQGTSASFVGELKEPNKLYFLQDTQEMYLGNVRYAFGKDVTVLINGSGDVVANAIWDSASKTLTITRGNAGDAASVQSAIESALTACVTHIYSDRGSAIEVDDSDKNNVKLSLNIAAAPHAGNVLLEECSDGLRASVEIPEVPVLGPKAGDKILSMDGRYLASTLSITTEVGSNGRQYIILKGIGGVEISKFDATDFVASGMLQSVTLEDHIVEGEVHKFLVMTFIVEGGRTSRVEVDLNELMNVYSAASGGGLTMSDQNEFSITNTVTPNYGVNVDHTIQFGQDVVLKTIEYDGHGLITGVHDITFRIPNTSGSVGEANTKGKLLTFVSITDGVLSGESVNIVTSIGSGSTDEQIPTAKSVYDLVDSATTKWDRF